MDRPLNKKQTLAVIEAVIALNARLLGEEPVLAARVGPKGWVRINYQRGKTPPFITHGPRDYSTLDRAMTAAWTSLARARAWAEGRNDWQEASDNPETWTTPLAALPEDVAS